MSTPVYKVYAVSDRVVRIEFDPASLSAPPVHVSSTGAKDALNPRTWDVVQTTPFPTPAVPLTILSVRMVDSYIYEMLTLQHFQRYNALPLHLKTTEYNGLKLEDDTYIDVGADAAADFAGSIQSADSSPNAKSTARGLQLKDVENRTTPFEDLVGGTLVINSSGDYASMSGEALVKKLVMRRLISQRGDFFHLPNYGAGLKVKDTFSTANLRQMAKDIEMQVLQEPEIEQARATLTYQAASSTLTIQVKARMRSTGQQTALSMNLPVGSIQF